MMHAVRRLLAFFRRDRLDDELAEEIRLHLDLRRRALMDEGCRRPKPNGKRAGSSATSPPSGSARAINGAARQRPRSFRT